MPQLSVITINFNNAAGLQKTIESVLSQSFTAFEFIIIDGNSTDRSVEVIKQYADKITYWISEKDGGIYEAMNKGLAVAKGTYCLFLNSGDYLFNKQVLQDVFAKNDTCEIIYGNMFFENRNEMKFAKQPETIGIIHLIRSTIFHPTAFIKRDLLLKASGYDTSFKIVGDYDFFVKAIIKLKASCCYIPTTISVFAVGGISNNEANNKLDIAERMEVHKRYFNTKQLNDATEYSKLINSIPYRFIHLVERKFGYQNLTKKIFNVNYY